MDTFGSVLASLSVSPSETLACSFVLGVVCGVVNATSDQSGSIRNMPAVLRKKGRWENVNRTETRSHTVAAATRLFSKAR